MSCVFAPRRAASSSPVHSRVQIHMRQGALWANGKPYGRIEAHTKQRRLKIALHLPSGALNNCVAPWSFVCRIRKSALKRKGQSDALRRWLRIQDVAIPPYGPWRRCAPVKKAEGRRCTYNSSGTHSIVKSCSRAHLCLELNDWDFTEECTRCLTTTS